MQSRVIAKLYRDVMSSEIPGYRPVRDLLIPTEPVSMIARGFMFESSAYSKVLFHVWVVMEPLFVPSPGITFGRRIYSSLEDDHDALADEARQACDVMRRYDGLIRATSDPAGWLRNWRKCCHSIRGVHAEEACGYANILTGNTMRGIAMLQFLLLHTSFDCFLDRSYEAGREVSGRVRTVVRAARTDPRQAVSMLEATCRERSEDLGLARL